MDSVLIIILVILSLPRIQNPVPFFAKGELTIYQKSNELTEWDDEFWDIDHA